MLLPRCAANTCFCRRALPRSALRELRWTGPAGAVLCPPPFPCLLPAALPAPAARVPAPAAWLTRLERAAATAAAAASSASYVGPHSADYPLPTRRYKHADWKIFEWAAKSGGSAAFESEMFAEFDVRSEGGLPVLASLHVLRLKD